MCFYPTVSAMDAGPHSSQSTRMRLLNSGLTQLRMQADRRGSSDIIHHLRNCVLTAQGALKLVEARLDRGDGDEVEMLLDLADSRLREGRALIVRSQRGRWPASVASRRTTVLVTA